MGRSSVCVNLMSVCHGGFTVILPHKSQPHHKMCNRMKQTKKGGQMGEVQQLTHSWQCSRTDPNDHT